MQFQMCKGQRILSRFIGVEVEGYEFYPCLNEWHPVGLEPAGEWIYNCSYKPCRSFRAFKRFLRKNPQFKGKSLLVSRIVNYDVKG
jgi:hypothetical protein